MVATCKNPTHLLQVTCAGSVHLAELPSVHLVLFTGQIRQQQQVGTLFMTNEAILT